MHKTWVTSFFVSLGLAGLALALWLGEITLRLRWEGLQWLSAFHYSIFLIAAFVIITYLLPFYFLMRFPIQRLLAAGTELYFVILAAFLLEKAILLMQYTQFYGFFNEDWLLLIQVLVLVMTSFSFYFITQRWLQSLSLQQVWTIVLGLLLPVPLSIITIHIIPGFGNGRWLADALKMGYPFFWTVLLMGIAGMMSTRFIKNAEPKPTQDDILDDQDF